MLFFRFFEIKYYCKEFGIKNYTINKDKSIDVNGNVNLSRNIFDRKRIPLKFNKVSGNFDCSYCKLITLENSPIEVGGYFNCSHNYLTNLEGGPKKVGGTFYGTNNQLASLKGCPKEIRGNFYLSKNKLTSFQEFPKKIGEGYYFDYNPIYNISILFKDVDEFKSLLDDYNYIRGNRIIKTRFEQACIDAGINMPKEIKGYTII